MTHYQITDRIRVNEEIRAWNLDSLNPWSDHFAQDPERRATAMTMVGFAERRIRELQRLLQKDAP